MAENVRRCAARVYRPHGSFSGHPCSRQATVELDGVLYCKIHDPIAKEQRRKDRGPSKFEQELIDSRNRVAREKALVEDNARLLAQVAELTECLRWAVVDGRGIDRSDFCEKCSGSGVRAYPSTATFRRGVGGSTITSDICDSCWGTGSRSRQGADLRHRS